MRRDTDFPVCGCVLPVFARLESVFEKTFCDNQPLRDKYLAGESELPAIGFSAYPGQSRTYPGASFEPAIFDVNITNPVSSYDPISSSFTCPITGLYTFSLTIFNQLDLYASIKVNIDDLEIGSVYADEGQGQQQSGVTVVVECGAGQRVWLETCCSQQSSLSSFKYNSFSGFLIQ